jgi:hypothetical protein
VGGQGTYFNDFVEEAYFKGKKDVPPVVGFVMGINVVLFLTGQNHALKFS